MKKRRRRRLSKEHRRKIGEGVRRQANSGPQLEGRDVKMTSPSAEEVAQEIASIIDSKLVEGVFKNEVVSSVSSVDHSIFPFSKRFTIGLEDGTVYEVIVRRFAPEPPFRPSEGPE